MKKIFLSYSSIDKQNVIRLANDLTNNEFDVWLDEWEIKVGESITQKIQEGIENCEYIAIWLTKNSINSGWVEREWQAKYSKEVSTGKVCILPLLAENCQLPALLSDKKYADFSADYHKGLKQLVAYFEETLILRQEEIEELIDKKRELLEFERYPQSGREYSIVMQKSSFDDEIKWIFWNEKEKTLEKWFSDSTRWYGPEKLNKNDLQIVFNILDKRIS